MSTPAINNSGVARISFMVDLSPPRTPLATPLINNHDQLVEIQTSIICSSRCIFETIAKENQQQTKQIPELVGSHEDLPLKNKDLSVQCAKLIEVNDQLSITLDSLLTQNRDLILKNNDLSMKCEKLMRINDRLSTKLNDLC